MVGPDSGRLAGGRGAVVIGEGSVKRVKSPGGLYLLAVVELLGCGGEGWEGWGRFLFSGHGAPEKDGVMQCGCTSILVAVGSVFFTCTASIDIEEKHRA